MKNKKLIKAVLAAMFAALVTGLTFFPKIPIPVGSGGYVHLGDAMIYLAASFLPLPYAMAAAGIGGGLADILSGYASYAPFTVVVKILLTIAFSYKNEKVLCKRNYIAPLFGLIITPLIYFFADGILAGSLAAAVPGIIWNECQAIASLIVYYIVGAAFDAAGLKKKLTGKLYSD
ncbi:MAG: TIGR04002 family protein [Clostridiales bacterium]|nr:TIGR04002 family protein [Clostridiales bacterium]MCD7827660.1 TIGR04002 family protein [Clostridiales bacterium]